MTPKGIWTARKGLVAGDTARHTSGLVVTRVRHPRRLAATPRAPPGAPWARPPSPGRRGSPPPPAPRRKTGVLLQHLLVRKNAGSLGSAGEGPEPDRPGDRVEGLAELVGDVEAGRRPGQDDDGPFAGDGQPVLDHLDRHLAPAGLGAVGPRQS